MSGWIDVEVVEEMGFLPSAVLSLDEPRMLKAESFELEAMLGDYARGLWKYGWFGRRCVLFLSLNNLSRCPASNYGVT